MHIRLVAAPWSCPPALRSEPPAPAHKEGDEIELYAADKIKWQEGRLLAQGGHDSRAGGKTQPGKDRSSSGSSSRWLPGATTHAPQDRASDGHLRTFNIGMGDKFDEKATKVMAAGAYGHWRPA